MVHLFLCGCIIIFIGGMICYGIGGLLGFVYLIGKIIKELFCCNVNNSNTDSNSDDTDKGM